MSHSMLNIGFRYKTIARLVKSSRAYPSEASSESTESSSSLLEVVSVTTGFRTVAIIDGLLTVNGRPIMIHGVNRHEHNVTTGQVVVTREEMLRDVLLMKQLGVNAVRTSHYPNHPMWYRLCSEHGLYVALPLLPHARITCPPASCVLHLSLDCVERSVATQRTKYSRSNSYENPSVEMNG